MDARRESEPAPMRNRTTSEWLSEYELVITRTFDPGASGFRGVDHARAVQAAVGRCKMPRTLTKAYGCWLSDFFSTNVYPNVYSQAACHPLHLRRPRTA